MTCLRNSLCRRLSLCCFSTVAPSQEFVNHGGVLFKLYILGDKVMVFRRNSLPDIQPGDDQSGPQQAVQLLEQKSSEALAVLVGSTAKEAPKEEGIEGGPYARPCSCTLEGLLGMSTDPVSDARCSNVALDGSVGAYFLCLGLCPTHPGLACVLPLCAWWRSRRGWWS